MAARTGGGQPSGLGFLGGYGNVARSAYATPADLGAKPWALDFNIDSGWPSFPTHLRVRTPMEWQTQDWDPGLRFWSLPFDERLGEWLQDVDLSAPSVLAAREFASLHGRWMPRPPGQHSLRGDMTRFEWISDLDLRWLDLQSPQEIDRELLELIDLMQRERAAYLDEAWLQSDNIPAYFIHFLGIDTPSKPWTYELMRCALSIGNLVYMSYKAKFKRARPSTLCPGLVPPWGPPRHPAFPSGHSFLGHFIALLLLEIPGVAQRFGIFELDSKGQQSSPSGRPPRLQDFVGHKPGDGYPAFGDNMNCPLLWLSWRLAVNRERIGVHYRSDSSASRTLAVGVWHALLHDPDSKTRIELPTLDVVLQHAKAEWPQAR